MDHHTVGRSGHRGRPPWRNGLPALALLTLPLLAACDRTPTDAGADQGVDRAEDLRLALEAGWNALPSTLDLELRALEELEVRPASGEAAALFLDAGDLAVQAGSERTHGSARDAQVLESAGETLLTRGLLTWLGGPRAGAILADMETGTARLEEALATLPSPGGAGSQGPEEPRRVLTDARSALTDARRALGSGDVAGALTSAGRAGETLRSLDRERAARAAVEAAWALLERATRVAGPSPDAPIARALADAGSACRSAREALGAGAWGEAMTRAQRCAGLARAVLARLADGLVDQDHLADRVEGVVAHAAALLERAKTQAGTSPDAAVRAVLAEAESLLARARSALGDGRYRPALRYAQESAARSLRVLRYLETIPGEDPLELRATAAVEAAQALLARVVAVLPGDPPPALGAAASAARTLVGEAESALQAGDWRLALARAREASALLMRILQALA